MRIGVVRGQFGGLFKGGAEVQIENTIIALREIGIEVIEIDYQATSIDDCDIIHFFKTDESFLLLANHLKAIDKPYVVSSIIYPETLLQKIYNTALFRASKYMSFNNFTNCMRFQLLTDASRIFPNTRAEEKYVQAISGNLNTEIIQNCVSDAFFDAEPDFRFDTEYPHLCNVRFVLNVGRVEPRKNQISLIKACQKMNLPLLIIGNETDPRYASACRDIGYEKVYFHGGENNIGFLKRAYRRCTVFALPSTMETPGLAALEAACEGAKILVTENGGAREYFGEGAEYTQSANVSEIISGLSKLISESEGSRINADDYRYFLAARKYESAYRRVLLEASQAHR